MNEELWKLDATALADLVRRREVSARELVELSLERIATVGAPLNAIAALDPERALAAADRSEPGEAHPFAGVPFLTKDLLPYPGVACSFGSRLFATMGHVPHEHLPYTAAIEQSGLVVLGTTTSSEFGLLGSTETLAHGTTRNPWRLDRSAGGSSGGAAAAVAAGLVPLAHASDGGGSIRLPAAMNGLFGLKPSRDRTLRAVPQPSAGSRITSEHCVSRSVRDSARFLACTERRDDDAPFAPLGFVSHGRRDRLRIGVVRESLLGAAPPPEGNAAVDRAVSLLVEMGHEVEEVSPPTGAGRSTSNAFFAIAGHFIDQLSRMMEPMLGREPGPDAFEPFTLELRDWYRSHDAGFFDDACAQLETAARALLEHQRRWDLTLSPTLGVPTPELGYMAPTLPMATILSRMEAFAGYTPAHNMAGACAMTVPLHVDPEGLPVGCHFAAMPGREDLLLTLAYALEEAAPWAGRWPTLAAPRTP